jgi:hypothetical protein
MKLNTYLVNAWDSDGDPLLTDHKLQAAWINTAWPRAIAAAFEACTPNSGQVPGRVEVNRLPGASESHG